MDTAQVVISATAPKRVVVVPNITEFLGDGWTDDVFNAIMEGRGGSPKATVIIGMPSLTGEQLLDSKFGDALVAWSDAHDTWIDICVKIPGRSGTVLAQPNCDIKQTHCGIYIATREFFDAFDGDESLAWQQIIPTDIGLDPSVRETVLLRLSTGASNVVSAILPSDPAEYPFREICVVNRDNRLHYRMFTAGEYLEPKAAKQ